MSVVYRPVRLLNREQLDTFRCLPAHEGDDGVVRGKKSLLTHDGDVLGTATKNANVLRDAFNQLSKAFATGQRYRMIVPINSYSMASGEGATLIVQAMKELDESIRPAVIAEFIDLPRSINLDMLADMMIPVLPFLDKYIAEPRPLGKDDNFTMFSNCNFFGVSLDMEAAKTGGDEAIALLTKFWAEATNSRLKVVLEGVREQAVTDKAQQYEVFAIDGPAIAEDRPDLI